MINTATLTTADIGRTVAPLVGQGSGILLSFVAGRLKIKVGEEVVIVQSKHYRFVEVEETPRSRHWRTCRKC